MEKKLNTLHKTIKRQWFDMIVSGEKKQEYLEIKDFWINRLLWHEFHFEVTCVNSLRHAIEELSESDSVFKMPSVFKSFEQVSARNGYSTTSPLVVWEHKGITIGEGKPEWGAIEGVIYFRIEIGEILSVTNNH